MYKLNPIIQPPYTMNIRNVYGRYNVYGKNGEFLGQICGKRNTEMVIEALSHYHENLKVKESYE